MRFKMPESLEGLDLAKISELREAALAEATELNKIADDKITSEETAQLIELAGHIGTLSERRDELDAQAQEQAQKLADARAALGEATKPGEPESKGEAPKAETPKAEAPKPDEPKGGAGDAAIAEVEPAKALVASGGRSFAAKVAGSNAADVAKLETMDTSKALSIRASANISGFESGQKLDSFTQLAEAYVNRAKSFASGAPAGRRGQKRGDLPSFAGAQLSGNATRYSVATLEKPENEFTLTDSMNAQAQYDMILAAASEARLDGGSLVAAGGWCSPSEIMYGFLELESAEGLLSIPEINASRGGIQFTKGPQLGDLLLEADLGFVQTEAEAEAGTAKPIFDIECPDWDEVRMDAAGYAIRAGLLTSTTYPELLRRYLALGLIVHARRMNALTIQRISTLIGAATTAASIGSATAYSATSDLLSYIELKATQVREQYSMPLNATVEGVFPLWITAIIRADLSRRNGGGRDLLSVTDQEITTWFSQRKIKANFVRDYQSINASAVTTLGGTAGWTRWPNRAEFMLYPAGSYVRLATPVIDLDTVYDVDNLTQNQFMAAFFEEGFGIANTGASGVKGLVNLDNVMGATGYPSIGALANVAPTP